LEAVANLSNYLPMDEALDIQIVNPQYPIKLSITFDENEVVEETLYEYLYYGDFVLDFAPVEEVVA
jgi:hypothetical protein